MRGSKKTKRRDAEFKSLSCKINSFVIPPQNECFRGYTGIILPVRVSVCHRIKNSSFCQSAGGGISPLPNKPLYLPVCSKTPLKTLWEKEKLLVTRNFSFSNSVFYPFGELSAIFYPILNYRLQTVSVWNGLKIVVWERVK